MKMNRYSIMKSTVQIATREKSTLTKGTRQERNCWWYQNVKIWGNFKI